MAREKAADAAEADEYGLAPGRGMRLRRRSRDLQQECLTLMDGALEKAFKEFDLDGNGTLDKKELFAAYQSTGRPVDEGTINRLVETLDTDKDGLVSLSEFKDIFEKSLV